MSACCTSMPVLPRSHVASVCFAKTGPVLPPGSYAETIQTSALLVVWLTGTGVNAGEPSPFSRLSPELNAAAGGLQDVSPLAGIGTHSMAALTNGGFVLGMVSS